MDIRQTSLQAHSDIQSDGTADSQRLRVLRHIRAYPEGLLRAEVSEELDIPINAVCGRIKELLKLGSVYEEGKRMNTKTHKANYILKASEIQVYEQ